RYIATRFPVPVVRGQQSGAAGSGGDAHAATAEIGGERAGEGFFAAGRLFLVGPEGETGGFLGVEFEQVNVASEFAGQVEIVVRRAQVDVENAPGGFR